MRNEVAVARSITVMAVLGVIAALYFAKAVFVPLALAILLTFLLAPAVRLLRSWGLPKPPAVVLVVTFAFAVILGLGALVGQQVTKLAQNLPIYQYNIEEKIRSARGFAGGGMLERISNFLADLNQEVGKKHDASSGSVPQPNEELTKPVPVEVHQPAATPMQVAERLLLPLVDPLTTAGLVVIFVIFFLSQRQDLRDRLIRLAGSHDLQRTTDAINDGAQRLSRYFVAQTALNVLFGFCLTVLSCTMMPTQGLFHNRHRLGVSRAGSRPLLLAGVSVAFANEMNRPSSPGCRLSTTSTLVTKCGLKHWPAVCGLRRGALAIKNRRSQSAGTRTGTKRKTLEEPPISRAANEREGEWPEPSGYRQRPRSPNPSFAHNFRAARSLRQRTDIARSRAGVLGATPAGFADRPQSAP
jgi:hypothetical protein